MIAMLRLGPATLVMLTLGLAGTCGATGVAIQSVGPYYPIEADFRATYDADLGNQGAQSFDDYYTWVKRFYDGYLLYPSWIALEKRAIAAIVPARQARAARGLDTIGFLTAAEWAKDNDHHRIKKEDLPGWGNRINDAAQKDSGSGSTLFPVIDQVSLDIRAKIQGPPAVPLPSRLTPPAPKPKPTPPTNHGTAPAVRPPAPKPPAKPHPKQTHGQAVAKKVKRKAAARKHKSGVKASKTGAPPKPGGAPDGG